METDASHVWRGGLCVEVNPLPCTLVIFGAAGDLAKRKLFPALYALHRRNLLAAGTSILACARADISDDSFRETVRSELASRADCVGTCMDDFLRRIRYLGGNYDDPGLYSALEVRLRELESPLPGRLPPDCRIFYLSTASDVYLKVVRHLSEAGLLPASGPTPARVVLEKPFGRDLNSAKQLTESLSNFLEETQLYRIDHYLGKETVQNILMFRFANLIFEPVWNHNFIRSVQISVCETIGVEHRAKYFDSFGLLRDMFQNHMLELLSLVAMEMPTAFDANGVRDEKRKLLRSIRPFSAERVRTDFVRAQYDAAERNGESLPGYLAEPGVRENSDTETFVAARFFLDNWRWQGVPFFLRAGKRMARRRSEIVIDFQQIPHSIFAPLHASDIAPNRLILTIQPEEGLTLSIQAKHPGPKLCMGALDMQFCYSELLEPGESMPDAYERLLLDCMLGDQTLFLRSDTIELAWSILEPVLHVWNDTPETAPLFRYPAGSWGPIRSDDLLYRENSCAWRNPL